MNFLFIRASKEEDKDPIILPVNITFNVLCNEALIKRSYTVKLLIITSFTLPCPMNMAGSEREVALKIIILTKICKYYQTMN